MFPSSTMYEMPTADSYQPSFFTFYSLQSLCLAHAGMPTGVAVSRCAIRSSDVANPHYASDPLPRLCGIIVEPDSSEPWPRDVISSTLKRAGCASSS